METSGKEMLVALMGLTVLVCGAFLLASSLRDLLEQFNAWLGSATSNGVGYATALVLGV